MTFRSRAMEWEETVHEAGREKVADPAFAPPPTLTRNQSLPDRNSPAGHDQAVYQAPSAGDVEMPNIVYVLTNPAMPGLVKIGMTDRDDVKRRMSDLYTTGVPLPFECVAAREIEDREAADIEKALHTAFGPNRVNSSREFFQIDPEQVQVLLRVMPGRDVTPRTASKETSLQDEDQAAATEYKKRQTRTNELDFMESVNEHGAVIYQRVLALGNQEGMRVRWTTKGFSLDVVSDDTMIPVCYGYPPSTFNQRMYTGFPSLLQKAGVPQNIADVLRQEALDTGLFQPSGKGMDLSCRTDLPLNESELDALTGWLNTVIAKVCEYEGVSRGEAQHRVET